MLTSIFKTIGSSMPSTNKIQYAITTVIIGRKVVLGTCCKIGAKFAELFENQNFEKLNKAGDDYLALASKTAIRDLTLIANSVAFKIAENTSPSNSFVLSQLSFAAAAIIAGRKLGLAGACKFTALAKKILNQSDVEAWEQSSNAYLERAKKDVFIDLKNAIPFVLTGFSFHVGAEMNALNAKKRFLGNFPSRIDKDIENLKKFSYLLTKASFLFS